jgi:phosphatidylinositol glycan class V
MACAKAAVLTAIILAPSLAYQYVAYRTFCLAPAVFGDIVPDWCDNTIPSIYNHVQSKYWNVGFLRYWTPSQAPNILLAAPVLSLIFTFGWYHLQAVVPGLVATILHIIIPNPKLVTSVPSSDPFLNLTLTPHVIHGVLLSAILLFAAHTQIALRLAASMPLTYWAAAWLLVRHPAWGRRWVTWSVVWGAISVVLWVVFLPPA